MSVSLEDIVSLCKRRGFIYQGSEIYGGLAGTWDWGPYGVRLKQAIENIWWERMVGQSDNIYPLDSAILMNPKVWEASGHVTGFTDSMVECLSCHTAFRADQIDLAKPCKHCGKSTGFSKPENFNMMLKTVVGPKYYSMEPVKDEALDVKVIGFKDKETNKPTGEVKIIDSENELSGFTLYDKNSRVYLRPETAQGIFVNYKNVVDSLQPNLPFGIAQIGKAFRNEISPRDFIFRDRELEQMEMQYFIPPDIQDKAYEEWRDFAWKFLTIDLQIPEKMLRWHEHDKDERAHYAAAAHDIEFEYPFGFKELWGTHNRTDYDLKAHEKLSGKSMAYIPKDGSEAFVPNVIESSVGLERMVLAVLTAAYQEDEQGGEKRVYLKLPAYLAPVKVAVFPLLKNKPELVKKAREVYEILKKDIGNVMWDDNGNIGKRYRRQDEIGTPFCVTIDFDTLEDGTVTVRHRDTTEQKRQKISELSL